MNDFTSTVEVKRDFKSRREPVWNSSSVISEEVYFFFILFFLIFSEVSDPGEAGVTDEGN